VLVIEHADEVVTAGPETVFVDGDHLVVFGRLDKVQSFFAPPKEYR
jgi:K+/H+ antiporter YhaU regulatory subunit KhtT